MNRIVHRARFALVVAIAAIACARSTGPSSAPGRAAPPSSAFQCFSWVHEAEFSTDCYRDAAECDRERRAMEGGARDTTVCRPAEHASCLRIGRLPGPATLERCFADIEACNRYSSFVQRNGHRVTVCAER